MNTTAVTAVTRAKPPIIASSARPMALIPRNMEETWRMSEAIAASGMAPKTYGTDPNKIFVGICHGLEVGFTPLMALQSIAVINGNPTIWGDGALALVRASGLLDEFSETLSGGGEKQIAVCRVKRKGHPAITKSFSVEDAKRAGLWAKSGPWQQYPQRMLGMRARSWALRDEFADVMRGLKIREEVLDMEPTEAGWQVAPPPPTREQFQAVTVEVVGSGGSGGHAGSEAQPAPDLVVIDPQPEAPRFEALDYTGEVLTADNPQSWAELLIEVMERSPDQLHAIYESNRAMVAMMKAMNQDGEAAALYAEQRYAELTQDERERQAAPKASDGREVYTALLSEMRDHKSKDALRKWSAGTEEHRRILKAASAELHADLVGKIQDYAKGLR